MESTNITNTVFSKLKPSNVNLDFSLLEAAFAEEPKAKPAATTAAAGGATGGISGSGAAHVSSNLYDTVVTVAYFGIAAWLYLCVQ
jgi:hypothetical protein